MPYGHLSEQQRKALRPFLEGKEVLDAGAGDLGVASQLFSCGVRRVYALDKDLPRVSPDDRIVLDRRAFEDYTGAPDLTLVSWPCNYAAKGLVGLTERSRVVVYLGKCTDGVLCGDESFWHALMNREVLLYSPDPRNTLIVYGETRLRRPHLGEERAGLYTNRIWSYEEVEAETKGDPASTSMLDRLRRWLARAA